VKRVLVTGAGGPAGINFVKSLQLIPEKTLVSGTEASEYYLHLIPTSKRYLVPKAKEPSYIERLNEIIHKERIDFLHPQPDVEVEVVSENREKIKTKTFLPSKKTVKVCQDKLESAKIWKQKNVPAAKTFLLQKKRRYRKSHGKAWKFNMDQSKAWRWRKRKYANRKQRNRLLLDRVLEI